MKILVAVKRVIDYKANIRVKTDGSGVETLHVKMSMNPFDEIAVEEAVRLKEKGLANEVIVVSIGQDAVSETLRTALAMGADRAILLKTETDIEPLAAAHLIRCVAEQESVSLILLGKQAIDMDHNQTGQMTAAILNWPQATCASHIEVTENHLRVVREIDGGLETLRLTLPAVITTDLRLNEPRYLSLPNIVQSKRKPLAVISAETFNVEMKPHLTILNVASPPQRQAGKRLDSVKELVDKLKHEVRVIG